MKITIVDYLIDEKSTLIVKVGGRELFFYYVDICKEINISVIEIVGSYNAVIEKIAQENDIILSFTDIEYIDRSGIVLQGNEFYYDKKLIGLIKKGSFDVSKAIIWKVEELADLTRGYITLLGLRQHAPFGYFFLVLGNALAEIFKFTPLTPNSVTLLSFFLAVGSAACFATGQHKIMLFGIILLLLHVALDIADGRLARLKHLESDFGKWFDTVIGRINANIIYLGIAYGLYLKYSAPLFLLGGGVFVLFEMMIDYMSLVSLGEAEDNRQDQNVDVEEISTLRKIHRFLFRWEPKFIAFAVFAIFDCLVVIFLFYLVYYFSIFWYLIMKKQKELKT